MQNKYGGINDAKVDKRVYGLWYQMLRRCYDHGQQERSRGKSYADCYVCERWLRLSNFAKDIKRLDGYSDWESKVGYCLDKDIRNPGNKVYSPTTCCFVPYTDNIREANKTKYVLHAEGITLIFDSEKAACEFLGVKKCSVASCRIKGSKCKGYTITCAKMDEEAE